LNSKENVLKIRGSENDMTEIIFSFDTEDFTSNTAADAIYREAEILREQGVRGGFCVVGLVAKQLLNWGRDDVLEALSHHDILSHTYKHSIHPTLHEYTDIEDFETAYKMVEAEEKEGIRLIKEAFPQKEILGACPPGNQKNYVAMYVYGDMNLPIYADTLCDTPDGQGMYYCNIYHTQYTFCMENFFGNNSDEYMKKTLDNLSHHKRVIFYTHPNAAIFSEFWDSVNYLGENSCEFGEWKECKKRPEEETEKYYDSIRRFIKHIKKDERFTITSFSALNDKLSKEEKRIIKKEDLPFIKECLEKDFAPINNPSYSISDIFLAVKDFLLGKDAHICEKVYGFLDTPQGVLEETTLIKEDILKTAKEMNTDKFLPYEIDIAGKKIGPADFIFAAIDVLLGAESVIIKPKKQLPSLDGTPRLRDVNFKGGWIQSESFEDKYISKRLRLQSWTMRF